MSVHSAEPVPLPGAESELPVAAGEAIVAAELAAHRAAEEAAAEAAESAAAEGAGGALPAAGARAAATAPDPLDVPLTRNRDFQVLLGGQTLAALGGAVTLTAMPLLVLQLTGSGVAMGIVGILGTLPDLIFGLPSGVLADRMDRKRLMMVSDLARAVLTALIPLSVILGLPTMAVILLVTFPINVFRVFFMAGWTGATPNLVSRRRLGTAVSAVESLVALSFIVGPAVAGILVGVIGAGPTLAVDAATLALSAVTLSFIRRPFQGERPAERASLMAEMREGMAFIWNHRVLRLAVGIWTLTGIVISGMVAAATYSVTINRGMGAADLGFVLSLYGAGNLLGALIGGRFTHGRLAPPLLGGYLVQGSATFVLGLPVAWPLAVLLVAAWFAGFGAGLTIVSYLTYRASATPDRLLSRVGSTARTISIGLQPIGLFITGILLDAVGGNTTIMLIGLGVVALAGLFALSPTLRAARGDASPAPAATAG